MTILFDNDNFTITAEKTDGDITRLSAEYKFGAQVAMKLDKAELESLYAALGDFLSQDK